MTGSGEILKEISLFVLDMDGTFYLGDRRLDGALEFVKAAQAAGKKILFLTNNSSKSPENYIDKLEKMECHINRAQIVTSGDVTIRFLKEYYDGKTVCLMGTKALEESFKQAGIRLTDGGADCGACADVVVIGFDTELTYEKLNRACTHIRNGAVFLATHPDINCPVEGGFIPDCGAMCAMIALSTGVQPKYLGKPYKETVDMVLDLTGAAKEKVAFVGDRIYTDVATGVNNGAKGFLVLTGETKAEDVEKSSVKPDAVFNSLGEMINYL